MKHKWKAGDIGRNDSNNWFVVSSNDTYTYLYGGSWKNSFEECHTPDTQFSSYIAEPDTKVEFLFNMGNIIDTVKPYGT